MSYVGAILYSQPPYGGLPFHGWKSPGIIWGEIRIEFYVQLGKSGSQYSPDLAPCDFWAFPTMKRELQGKKF
jgi:hypothetical protein